MNIKRVISILEKLAQTPESITIKERYELHEFLKDDSNKQLLDQWFSDKWHLAQNDSPDSVVDLDDLFEKIGKEILLEGEKTRRRGILFYFNRVAAILFIPLLLWVGFLMIDGKGWGSSSSKVLSEGTFAIVQASQEYISPAGTRSKIILPDSTLIWLNSESSVKIDENFGKSNRDLYLSGQAYFDVMKNRDLKFVIQMDRAKVIVTGTTLSVRNYKDDNTIETTLLSGSAEVVHNNVVTNLTPAHTVIIDKKMAEASPVVAAVTSEASSKWKDGVIIFDRTTVIEAIRTLERWYNVSFENFDRSIGSQRITARFDNCSLSQILSYLSLSLQVECRYNEADHTVEVRSLRAPVK